MPSPTSADSSMSYTLSRNSTVDCKALRIRRNQLPQVFDAQSVSILIELLLLRNSFFLVPLKTIYNLSGVPYSSSNQAEARSQIDARSIDSRWSSPINYYIDTTTGFTSAMIANSKCMTHSSDHLFVSISAVHTAISNWATNTCLIFNELPFVHINNQ